MVQLEEDCHLIHSGAKPVADRADAHSELGGPFAPIAIALLLLGLLSALVWVGYTGTDDGSYADGARDLVQRFPFPGTTHWSLRQPVVLPIALEFKLFGLSEVALGIPMLLYLAAAVASTMWLLTQRFGHEEAIIFAAIFCTMPGAVVYGTFANDDVAELCFVVLSVTAFLAAARRDTNHFLLVLTGILAGFAFLARETTVALVLGYGVLFLAGFGVPRSRYFLIAAGFALVIAADILYFTATTGHPLYRYLVDVNNDTVNRAAESARVIAGGDVIDKEGNLTLGSVVDPLLVFFASQKFGLVFYLVLGVLPVILIRPFGELQTQTIRGIGVVGLCWAAFIILSVGLLWIVPRYFLVAAWAAAALSAVGLCRLRNARPRLATAILGVVLAVNGLCLYLENTDPIMASRGVIAFAKNNHTAIYTDPRTAWRGRLVADIEGVAANVKTAPPPDGSFYAYAPDTLAFCRSGSCGFEPEAYVPPAHWTVVGRYVPTPRAIAGVLQALGLEQRLPEQLRRKIETPNAGIIIYQVKASQP